MKCSDVYSYRCAPFKCLLYYTMHVKMLFIQFTNLINICVNSKLRLSNTASKCIGHVWDIHIEKAITYKLLNGLCVFNLLNTAKRYMFSKLRRNMNCKSDITYFQNGFSGNEIYWYVLSVDLLICVMYCEAPWSIFLEYIFRDRLRGIHSATSRMKEVVWK